MRATTPPVKPWYREPWPWLLMLAPLAAVVMGVVMLTLAVRSNDGLVVDDYYQQGLAINQTLERQRRAAKLAVRVGLDFSDGQIIATLDQRGARSEAMLLTLVHPTRAGRDRQVLLVPRGGGTYAGALATPGRGRWHVVLEDADRTWRLSGLWEVGQRSVRLAAETPAGE
ncbi:MAG: FixH family protein [Burkholderiales bacterium]|nr:FixH family protein [Burkholderiales bacterium]